MNTQKIKISVALLLASYTLFGCATTPISSFDAKQVPSDRLLAFQDKTTKFTASIIATRDQGMVGSACYLALSINGILAGRFSESDTANFYLQPGEYVLKVSWDPMGRGLCSLGSDISASTETVVKPGQKKYFRLMIGDGSLNIQRVDDP